MAETRIVFLGNKKAPPICENEATCVYEATPQHDPDPTPQPDQPPFGSYIDIPNLNRDVVEIRYGTPKQDKPTILLIGDSRLELLQKALRDKSQCPYIINYAYGLNSTEITPILDRILTHEKIGFVIIMTGGCDITGMENSKLLFEEEDVNIPARIAEIMSEYSKIIALVTKLQFTTGTIISGFYGVELHTYNQTADRNDRQDALDDTVWLINSKIHQINCSRFAPNLRIDHLIHKNLTKHKWRKRSHSYSRLLDGFHPDAEVDEAVATHLHRLIEKLVKVYSTLYL